ncbi:MAG: hypothetical protein JWQ43_2506 [Glaciihabitans sp.]|nr:hypothetical protein [Glaciihabitans sp.]
MSPLYAANAASPTLHTGPIATTAPDLGISPLVGSSSMQFVGRRDEMARIAQVAGGTRESALLVVGDAGSGKTRLLECAQSESSIRSVFVHTMSAEAAWPMSGFSRVFAFVNDVSSADFFGRFTPRSAERVDTFEAARDLLSTLRSLLPEPVLVLVDDIDRMDAESQILLSFVAEGLAGTGIRLVATATDVPSSSPLSSFRRLDLPPLSDAESRTLAAAAAGAASDPGTVRIVADAAGGSPLAIVESIHLLGPLQIQGREPLVLPFRPAGARHSLGDSSLLGLDGAERAMLDLLCVAPRSNVAALVSGAPDEGDALEDLAYADLVTMRGHCVQVRDRRLRAQLYWNLEPRTRRELHRKMAEAHQGHDSRMVEWHTSFISPTGDTPNTLLRDATEIAGEGDVATAVEFAEHAIRVAGSVANHLPALIDFAAVLLDQTELDLAFRYAQLGRYESTSAELSMRLAALLVRISYAKNHLVPTNDIDATLSIYSGQDPAGATDLLCIAATFHAERWEIEEARRYLARAEQIRADQTQSDQTQADQSRADQANGDGSHSAVEDELAAIKDLVDAIDGTPAESPAALADVVDSGRVSSMPVPALVTLGKTLMFREQYARARHVFTIVLNQPQTAAPLWLEAARYQLAVNEVRGGNFHRARTAVEDWLATASSEARSKSSRLLLHGWYQQSSGKGLDAKSTLEECMEQTLSERNPAVAAQVLSLEGATFLSEGDFNEAARLLETADVIGQRFTNPALLRSGIDLMDAYVATKRVREARSVLETLEAQQLRFPTRWLTLALARGRALTASDDECLSLFRQALQLFGPTDSAFELGRTLTNYASAQARLGFGRESEKSLAAARSAFGNAGAQSWSLRASKARSTPETDVITALGVLTEEEQLIVEKVREGYRNKEIAAALYISLRTVELRLTHIYRKVGARSRSHLAALLN